MSDKWIEMLFKHNNWANLRIIEVCSSLTDEQLDAEPTSATRGSIRITLSHLATAQLGYLRLMTLPVEERLEQLPIPPFNELRQHVMASGEALLALVQDEPSRLNDSVVRSRDNYLMEPWVVILQIINHATEHREQIKSMLTAMGVTPPEIDGWSYGDFTGAISPMEKKEGS